LRNLQQIPLLNDLRLVGGTALALHIGHRHSIDLDFFGMIDADGFLIADEIKFHGLDDIRLTKNGRSIKIFYINKVKVDIVNYGYQWIEPPVEEEGLRLAGLKDIAAMKLAAITNRGTKKDFVDIYFLLKHFSIIQMLEFYDIKYAYGSLFNVVRSLSYFADAEENDMPQMFIPAEWETIKTVIREAVKDYLQ
jgi:predicted nucleotidyltransferase component of viral defense system